MAKAKKKLRLRVVKIQVELNDDAGTLVDCEWKAPGGKRRQVRELWIEGVFRSLTSKETRFISRAVREGKRRAEWTTGPRRRRLAC